VIALFRRAATNGRDRSNQRHAATPRRGRRAPVPGDRRGGAWCCVQQNAATISFSAW